MFDLPEKDLPRLLGEVRGLILGPTLTMHPGVTAELAAHLGLAPIAPSLPPTFHQTLFDGVGSGSPDDLRAKVEAFVDAVPSGPLLPDLARVSWKAVLSATPDLRFENLFKQEMDRKPHRNPVAVIDDLSRPVPPRKVPVFKLVGSVARADLLLTRTQFYQRKAQWRASVRAFVEQTRGAPLLCLGMDESVDILQELFSEMIAQPHLRPSLVALLGDDPLAGNKHIADLVDSFSKLCVIQASTSTLPKALAASPTAAGASVSGENQAHFLNLGVLSNLVSVVNQHLVPSSSRTERHRLLDLLFSPAVANWEPFAHNFDFPRSAAEVLADLNAVLNTNPFSSCAAVITGGSASGKTVLLKRLAFDLAKKGRQVLWLRPALYPDSDQVLVEVFKAVNRLLKNQRVVVVMDDPPSFMSLTPRDVIRAARTASLDILLLVAVRTSEWSVRDTRDFVGPVEVKVHAELPDSLDDAEWLSLPDYLVQLNVYANRSFAETAMRAIQKRSAADTLSTLYWLVPETKNTIASSIKDEYFRLGDVSGLSRVLIGSVNKTSKILKDAYEYVAVGNHYRTSVPIEVLVAALDVPYADWIEAASPAGAAWGLLYPDIDPRDEGASYNTRNDVVTRILVSAINGGATSYAGEVRLLRKLLAACGGTNPLYREFCVRALVRNETLERLDYQDGLSLFDAAIDALPFPDKTLLHHKARWIKNRGKDPLNAAPVLEKALAAAQYPQASQSESDEHIHNTIAANFLDLVEHGHVTLQTGKAAILEHLSLARTTQFFNSHSAHVQANMILSLIDRLPSDDLVDVATLSARALSEIDTTVATMRHVSGTDAVTTEDDLNMLLQARTKLLGKLKPVEDLKVDAEEQWHSFQSQNGFVVVARKLLDGAILSGKGHEYQQAFQYCLDSIDLVRKGGTDPSSGLAEVAAYIYYSWRVLRRISTKNAPNVIDWELVRQLTSVALVSRRGGQDAFNQYLQALALAQLGRWADADAIFGTLRQAKMPTDVLWLPRELLLDANGTPRRVQGVIRVGGGDRAFLHTEELGTDFRADRNEQWPRSGEMVHAHVRFAFGGTTAIPALALP